MSNLSTADPCRDAIGMALAYLDDDDGRLAALLEPYTFTGRELHLLVAVLALIPCDRDGDGDDLDAFLRGQALAGAGAA